MCLLSLSQSQWNNLRHAVYAKMSKTTTLPSLATNSGSRIVCYPVAMCDQANDQPEVCCLWFSHTLLKPRDCLMNTLINCQYVLSLQTSVIQSKQESRALQAI